MRRYAVPTALLIALAASPGCATTSSYVYNDTELDVHIADSDLHTITYVRVYAEGGETVLYGEVSHRHRRGAPEAHVDLSLEDPGGTVAGIETLALRPASPKQRGWHGAAFRTRLKPAPALGTRISLAVHDGAASPRCDGDRGRAAPAGSASVGADGE